MKRREALSAMGLISGAALLSSESFLASCSGINRNEYVGILNNSQLNQLNEIGEAILPETDSSPGAKEAQVAEFMNVIVTEYFNEAQKNEFISGLKRIEERVNSFFGGFGSLETEEQKQILSELENEAGKHLGQMKPSKKIEPVYHFYIMIKQMTIWGYLSSEIVAKTAFIHAPIPGKYEACNNYSLGEKAVFGGSNSGQGFGYATHHMRSV